MNLLLVESHRSLAHSLQTGLEEEGFVLTPVDNPDDALSLLRSRKFAAIIVDLPGHKEKTVLESWRQEQITTPVLVLSAPGSSLERLSELDLGPGAFLAKPFHFDDLLDRLARLIQPT